jgi:Leucine-rich repeat (LRR) protein
MRLCNVLLQKLFLLLILSLSSIVSTQAATDCGAQTEVPRVECEALVALYNSTNGANWLDKTGWNETNTPCSWNGVTCESGHITKLFLDWNQLTGSIPAELGKLSNLQELILSDNQLTGSIPAALGNLSNLYGLGLNTNQFTGSIPAALGNLSNLQTLDLSSNQLTGSIPAELGNLSNLYYLGLYENQLTGSIPAELGNLSNLQVLYLAVNQLTGSIPSLSTLTVLTYLGLSNNSLCRDAAINYSPWESEVNSYPVCGEISSTNCGAQTQIPSVECEALIALYNSTNGANWYKNTGWNESYTPCSWYLVTCENGHIVNLYLGGNQLTGSIPAALGNLSNLTSLDLGWNQLTGSIPAALGNLSNLQELFLSYNQLTGSIPAELGNLSNLQYLFLLDNQLTGSIPAALGNLSNLTSLVLDSNQLTGSIPAEIGNLSSLAYLHLSYNQLTGSIPSLSTLTALSWLDLSSNFLCRDAAINYSPWESEVNNYPVCGEISSFCSNAECHFSILFKQPGFYVATVNLPQGSKEGMWGVEFKTFGNISTGGFNSGAILKENGDRPGFMAFYLSGAESVNITPYEYTGAVSQMKIQLSRQEIETGARTVVFGPENSTSGQTHSTAVLKPGFYVAESFSESGSPRGRFGFEVSAKSMAVGVNVGGWIDSYTGGNGEGFGGLYVDKSQTVNVNVFFGESYSSIGSDYIELNVYRQENGERTLVFSGSR